MEYNSENNQQKKYQNIIEEYENKLRQQEFLYNSLLEKQNNSLLEKQRKQVSSKQEVSKQEVSKQQVSLENETDYQILLLILIGILILIFLVYQIFFNRYENLRNMIIPQQQPQQQPQIVYSIPNSNNVNNGFQQLYSIQPINVRV